tara:strand:+ start:148 stop:390 length:243 start_codon:yes stop_codon:yes gene_type:complete
MKGPAVTKITFTNRQPKEIYMATMQTFVANEWVELAKGKELFSKVSDSGVPIRVLHPNGNFKVIRNADKLPESVATTSTA